MEIKLRDFYQSVVLRCLGYELKELERGTGKFVNFVFLDPKDTAQKDLSDYWERKTKVVARDLIDAINELKTKLYQN